MNTFRNQTPEKLAKLIEQLKQILLQPTILTTAVVTLSNLRYENPSRVRILFDSGSCKSFITSEALSSLSLQTSTEQFGVNFGIKGLGGTHLTDITQACIIRVSKVPICCLIIDKMGLPSYIPSYNPALEYSHLKDLPLADEFDGKITTEHSVLIGGDFFKGFLPSQSNIIKGNINEPIAIETTIGYVLIGPSKSDLPRAGGSAAKANGVTLSINNVTFKTNDIVASENCTDTEVEEIFNLVLHDDKNSDSCSNTDLKNLLESYFGMENFGYRGEDLTQNTIKQEVEEHFLRTYKYCADLKCYEVTLFTKEDCYVGSNQAEAQKRFFSLERRLKRNLELGKVLHEEFAEFIDHKFIERYDCQQHASQGINESHIPYSLVAASKESSFTVRPVFDFSAKSETGLSVNNIVEQGLANLASLIGIILRLRCGKVEKSGYKPARYILTSDISKCFYSIKISEDSRNLTKFFYRASEEEELEVWRFTKLPMGLLSSPWYSTAIINQHLERFIEGPVLQKRLAESVYVDDITISVESVAEGKELVDKMIETFALGGFKMHKFQATENGIISHLPEELKSKQFKQFETSLIPCPSQQRLEGKALGICLDFAKDLIFFDMKREEGDIETETISSHFTKYLDPLIAITKRQLVSVIAKIWDPLGILDPFNCRAKIFIQKSHKMSKSWDLPLVGLSPDGDLMLTQFRTWLKEIPSLSKIRIPRPANTKDNIKEIRILAFSDASKILVSTCIYLQTIYTDKTTESNLILAKNKLAPTPERTINVLEAMGILLASEGIRFVAKELNISLDNCHIFSDSVCAVVWSKSPAPGKYTVFLKHRVEDIQKIMHTENIHWIAGGQNPADANSRGKPALELVDSTMWWKGPPSIMECTETSQFPIQPLPLQIPEDCKKEIKTINTTNVIYMTDEITKRHKYDASLRKYGFHAFMRLLRITSYVLKFIKTVLSRVKAKGLKLKYEPNRALTIGLEGPEQFTEMTPPKPFDSTKDKWSFSKLCFQRIFIPPTALAASAHFHYRLVQQTTYPKEYDALSECQCSENSVECKCIHRGSKLFTLDPIFDKETGLIRIKLRMPDGENPKDITNSHLPNFRPIDFLLPWANYHIILPHDNQFTEMLILFYHYSYCSNPDQTLYLIREQMLWITNGYDYTKKITKKCMACKAASAKHLAVKMSPLPWCRITINPVYAYIFIDAMGPFDCFEVFDHEPADQDKKKRKCWVMLFCCAYSRHTSARLMYTLNTDAVIRAIHSIGRQYGYSRFIKTDLASSFKKARKEYIGLFSKIDWKRIMGETAERGTEWQFSGAAHSHWRVGAIERLVALAKNVMRRTIGTTLMTYSQFIETIEFVCSSLNARPLATSSEVASEDPDNAAPITPQKLVTGRDIITPTDNLISIPPHFSARSKLQKGVVTRFQAAYKRFYVHNILLPKKWYRSSENLPIVGDYYFMNENLSRKFKHSFLDYKVVRIEQLIESPIDNKVRTVKVLYKGKNYIRAVQSLIPLEASKIRIEKEAIIMNPEQVIEKPVETEIIPSEEINIDKPVETEIIPPRTPSRYNLRPARTKKLV